MNLTHLLKRYELLVAGADRAFQKMSEDFPDCIKCKPHCSDCCHAVFGLFLIEAAYLKQHFDQLNSLEIRAVLLRCNDTERALKKLEIKLQTYEDDPQMQAFTLAKERIRCPLLNANDECTLYPYRPITCRVYGIPTKIKGKARVCGKSGFKKGESYSAFDLDGVYGELYSLSKELIEGAAISDLEKASLLISVSKAVKTPLEELINEGYG